MQNRVSLIIISKQKPTFKLRKDHENASLYSPVYNLLSADLRTAPSEHLEPLLASSSTIPPDQTSPHAENLLLPSLPTLLLFECVLVYMTPTASCNLIKWFVDYFSGKGALGAIVYEMFGLDDAFGRMMLSNLKKVRCVLSFMSCGHESTELS